MEILVAVSAGISAVGVFVLGLTLTAYALAHYDIIFTLVDEREIKFVTAGGDLRYILINVKNKTIDGDRSIVDDNTSGFRKILNPWKYGWFGIYGPFFWPIYTIHEYKFEWAEWEKKKTDTGEYKIRMREPEVVDSMYHLFTYPIETKGVELLSGFTVDIVGEITFEAIDPELAVFALKGKWFLKAVNVVNGAIDNCCKNPKIPDYTSFNSEDKQVLISEYLRRFQSVTRDPVTKEYENVLIRVAGVRVAAYNYVSSTPAGSDAESVKAQKAKELATLNGEALFETSKYQAKGIREVGGAEAEVLDKQKTAVGSENMPHYLQSRATAKLAEFKGQVLNIGGTGSPTIVNLPPVNPIKTKGTP